MSLQDSWSKICQKGSMGLKGNSTKICVIKGGGLIPLQILGNTRGIRKCPSEITFYDLYLAKNIIVHPTGQEISIYPGIGGHS